MSSSGALPSFRGAVVRRRGGLTTALAQGGGWFVGGSEAPEVRVGIGGNPCRRGRHRRGGARGCHLTFREGVWGYPASRLVVYRGKPLAAASSSSRSFLEVLIGAGASESWSLVEDPGGRSDREASSFLLIRRCRHLFLCSFSVFSFGRDCAASAPASIPVWFGWLLCIQSGRGTLFRQ